MKFLYYFPFSLFLVAASSANGDDLSLLSDTKKNILNYEYKNIDAEHQKLRNDWLSPINLNGSYSTNKSAQGDYHNTLGSVSASLSQDIFRSGGITYQIEYADAKQQTRSIQLKQTIASLNGQIFNTLLNLKKIAISLSKAIFVSKTKR